MRDTTPPTLQVAAAPGLLWPPNHRLVRVALAPHAIDRCDPSPVVALESATSSEPDDLPGPSDGSTTGDIGGADLGTADTEAWLRAERIEGGAGRTYRLGYGARDASGNIATSAAIVSVPPSRAGLDPRRALRPEPFGAGVTAVLPY